jgi:hypothetical protein
MFAGYRDKRRNLPEKISTSESDFTPGISSRLPTPGRIGNELDTPRVGRKRMAGDRHRGFRNDPPVVHGRLSSLDGIVHDWKNEGWHYADRLMRRNGGETKR